MYRAPRIQRLEADPREWMEVRWLAFEPGFVKEVRFEGIAVGGAVGFAREEGTVNRWRDAASGEPVAASRVRAVLKRVGTLFADGVEGVDREGLGETQLEVVLALSDGEQIRASFGARVGEQWRLAARVQEQWPWVVRIREKGFGDLVEAVQAVR